jgi:membrane-associated phospholipid phosphatase
VGVNKEMGQVILRRPLLLGWFAVAVVVFASMWLGWTMRWSWLATIDASILAALYHFGVDRPGWVTAWDVLCTVLGPVTFRLAGAALIVWALVLRQWRVALFLFLSMELAGLVTVAVKAATDRPRPSTAFVEAASSSFPSGHALEVMVGVLALSTVLLPMIHGAGRLWALAAGAAVVVAVGVGRVVLNVHHPSDVIAGWALGYVYFAACLLVFARSRVKEADERPEAPDTST